MALLERARWEATFDVPGFDKELYWNEIQDSVDNTEIGLMANCDDLLADLATTITNNVTTVINNVTQQIISGDGICCFPEDNPVEDPDPTDNPPGGTPTGSERDEICKSAQLAHDNGAKFLEDVFSLADVGTGISAGVIAFIIALYVMTLPLALLSTVIGLIVGISSDLLTDTVKSQWDAIKQEVVCAIYTAISAGHAKTKVHQVIDEAQILDVAKLLFKALYNQGQINKIWNGQIGNTGAYSADYCDVCGQIYFLNFPFDAGMEGWNNTESAWVSNPDGGWVECRVNGVGNTPRTGFTRSAILAATGETGGDIDVLYLAANFQNGTGFNVVGNGVGIQVFGTGGLVQIDGQLFGDNDTTFLETSQDLDERIGSTGVVAFCSLISQSGEGVYTYIDNISLVVRIT